MRIFNETKTTELHNPNLENGYLRADKRFIAHREAVEGAEEQGHYETTCEYPNGGKDVKWVIDVPAAEAREAYDEYEEILIYVPYTEEEKRNLLRSKRAPLLSAFDKWEKAVLRGRETDDEAVMAWYRSLLDLDGEAFERIPERVRYYMQ